MNTAHFPMDEVNSSIHHLPGKSFTFNAVVGKLGSDDNPFQRNTILPVVSYGRISLTWHTVDGRNPAPVEVGSLSHYLQDFMNIPRADRRISEPSTVHNRIIFRDFPARIHITPLLDRSVLSQFSKKFIVWNFHPSPATLLTPPPLPKDW